MKNKKIILFDNFSSGHHETYILIYAKKLLELGNKVLIFYTREDIFSSLKQQYNDQIKVHVINTNLNIPIKTYKNKYSSAIFNTIIPILYWIRVKLVIKKGLEKVKESKPDLVFFLWLDSFLNPLLRGWMVDLFFKFKWAGIYFHPIYLRNHNQSSRVNRPNDIFKSKFCQFITILDGGVYNKLSANTDKKVYVLPDVTNEEINQNNKIKDDILKKAGSRKIIGLLGSISKRKGLSSLIEVIKKISPDKYFFIIAGNLWVDDYTEDDLKIINSFFKENSNNCFSILKRIDDEKDFNTLINLCDMLLAVYEDFFHSSNILTKAALFNKFVIVSNKYLMAERVEKFQLGLCIEQKNSTELLGAIELLSNGENFAGEKLKPQFEKYFSEHSQAKLSRVLSEINI